MPESKANHRDPPPITPPELIGNKFVCSACSQEQKIGWHEKQSFPKESIASNAGNGHWVPTSFSNTCRTCSHSNDIIAERGEIRGHLRISADEASRKIDDISMFLLADCGISSDKRNTITTKIRMLESDLARESGGCLTSFHAKDIMSGKSWP